MDEEEFLAFCSLPETQVVFLESGHDRISQSSPAQDFSFRLHQLRRQHSGDGSRVFMAWGGTSLGQVSHSLKYVIHAEDIGYDNVRPVVVGMPNRITLCEFYIDQALALLNRFRSFREFRKLADTVEAFIEVSEDLFLSPEAKASIDPFWYQERSEFQDMALDEIIEGTVISEDVNIDKVQEKIRQRDSLIDMLRPEINSGRVNSLLTVAMYKTLCNSVDEIMSVAHRGWKLERYKALLERMKNHLYPVTEKETVEQVMRNATSIYAGGGAALYMSRNLRRLQGIGWLRKLVTSMQIPWQGYSMGNVLAFDKMIVMSPTIESNGDGQLYVSDCYFENEGDGLGLFSEAAVVVHGEIYCGPDGLRDIALAQLRKQDEAWVFINNATLVKATHNGSKMYRAFVDRGSVLQVYYRGELLQEYGPGQTQLDIGALAERIAQVRGNVVRL